MTAESIEINDFRKAEALFIKTIKSHAIEIPMLPEVANKVVRLTQDPESDAAKLSSLIQSDQTLAAHVMRVANSAAYSPNSNISSLQQAISRLGMQLISEIALAASINSEMFYAPGFENHIAFELKYSLASGLWAKEVARACRKNVEAAFLSGLLHDIGRPVAVQAAVKMMKKYKLILSNDDILKLEEAFQNIVGVQVVEEWSMPKSVLSAIQYFTCYEKDHPGQYQTMAVVAGAAIADHFLCPESEISHCSTREELISHPVLADLNLYEDEIIELLNKHDAINAAMEAMSA